MIAPADASSLRGARGSQRERIMEAAWVLLLFAGSLALRCLHLGTWSFWADELATLRDAQQLREVLGYPVGYALIGAFVSRCGVTEFTARFVPAMAGALTVPLVYLLGRRMYSARVGSIAALWMALSCFHLFFSQFARYYTLVTLFGVGAMACAWEGFERNDRRWLGAGVALLALAFWTHWSAGILAPAALVYVLWRRRDGDRPRGVRFANLAFYLVVPVVAGAILAPQFLGFLRGWLRGDGFSVSEAARVAAALAYRMELPVLLCAGVAAWMLRRLNDRHVKWLLVYAALPALMTVILVGFSQGGSRFGLLALPPLFILAARGIVLLLEWTQGRRRLLVWTVPALTLVAILGKDAAYFTQERGQRPRWREAAAALADAPPSAEVIATSPEILMHYTGRYATALHALAPDVLEARLAAPAPVYVFVEHVANVAPAADTTDVLRRHARHAHEWPLRVAGLDYSITLYVGGATRDSN